LRAIAFLGYRLHLFYKKDFFATPLYHIQKATSNLTVRFALRGIRFAAIWHIFGWVKEFLLICYG
jgi:hypothetical protein